MQDRPDDQLSRRSANVTDHIRQLHVHLRERFLHPLSASSAIGNLLLPLPPNRSHHPNFLLRPKRIVEQPIDVQL
jgi:hypothetical protein